MILVRGGAARAALSGAVALKDALQAEQADGEGGFSIEKLPPHP